MPDRQTIETILRQVYEARSRGDVDAVMSHLSDDVDYAIAATPADSPLGHETRGRAAAREAVAGLVDTFVFSGAELKLLLIDGNRAAAHWHVRVHAPSTGRSVETELLDLVTFEGDRISQYRQFCDTAVAAWLLTDDVTPAS